MAFNDGQVMKNLKGYFDYEQIERVLQHIKGSGRLRAYRDWLFFYLLSRTGRRISELLALKVSNIDFDKADIVWNILKKRYPKVIIKAIDSTSLAYIKEYFERNRGYVMAHDGKLFPFKRDWGRKLCYRYITETNINMFDINGNIVKPHPHHFRHSFAINYIKKIQRPEALKLLQQELEHTNIATTGQYLQFSNEDQRQIKETLFGKKEEKNNEP